MQHRPSTVTRRFGQTVRVGAWLARHWRRTSGQGPSPWGRGVRRHIGGAAPRPRRHPSPSFCLLPERCPLRPAPDGEEEG